MMKIQIESRGSLNDFITHLNFIYKLKQRYNLEISLVRNSMTQLELEVIRRCEVVDSYFTEESAWKEEKQNVKLVMQYVPYLTQEDQSVQEMPQLRKLLLSWRKFQEEMERKRYIEHPLYDANIFVYGMNNRMNCLELTDPSGDLGIRKNYALPLKSNVKDITSIYGNYITIHAPDHKYTRTREWKTDFYNKLIDGLHDEFPDYNIIQIGMEPGKPLKNIDVFLVERLSPSDFCDLLGAAYLHVDTIPDYAHLRAAMGRISCMLWGSMPYKFFSLPRDINVYADSCKHWCMNVNDMWMESCLLGDVRCLHDITPENVLMNIKKNRDRLLQDGGFGENL